MPSKKRIYKRGCESSEVCKSFPTFRVSSCPLGPQEPAAPEGTATFGSLYGINSLRRAIQGVPIEFDFPGPVSNTIADPVTNSITVLTNGVFEISANLENSNIGTSFIRYGIRRNNVLIAGSLFSSGETSAITIGKTIQTALVAGDIITVVPELVTGDVGYNLASFTLHLIGP